MQLYIMFYFILDHLGSTVLIMKLFLNYFKYNNVQIKWKAKNNIPLVTLSEQLKKPIKKSLLEAKSIHLTSNDAAMQFFATSNLTYTRAKQRCCEELSNLEHYA